MMKPKENEIQHSRQMSMWKVWAIKEKNSSNKLAWKKIWISMKCLNWYKNGRKFYIE